MTARGVVVGTAGHVDHGKTTLVEALTGVNTDRWREERERGLTIDIGFARLADMPGLEVGLVDVPGHEDFLKNMLAGATGIDLLLLVVAADEGPMPQTHEHLAVASLLGITDGVAAVAKADRVDGEWLELAAEATREALVRHLGARGREWPVLAVSGTTGAGVEEVRAALLEAARRPAARSGGDLFRMPVDRAFTIRGTGTVVTGTVWSGTATRGDALRLLPADRPVRVRGLEVHGEARESVGPGRRCALALVGVDPVEAPRGTTVVGAGPWPVARRLGAEVRTLTGASAPLEHGDRVRVYLGTREVVARLLLAEPERPVAAGRAAPAVLKLEEPLVARVRDRFILRGWSPVRTVGGGRVARLDPDRAWRDRADAWRDVLEGSVAEAMAAAVEGGGGVGLADASLPVATGLAPAALAAVREEPPPRTLRLEERWFAAAELERARGALLEALEALHRRNRRAAAASLEALRSAARRRRWHPDLVERALAELTAEGRLLMEGPEVRLPKHAPRLDPEEAALKDRLAGLIAEGGAEPPSVEELQRTLPLDRELLDDLLRLLAREGEVEAVTPEMYVSRATAEHLVGQARALLRDARGVVPPGAFKEAFGVTRKHLIPILEWLDRRGVTRRTGEGRMAAG